MAFTPKKLVQGTLLTTSAVTLYTCPANTRVSITKVSVCETSGAARTVTIHIVASGDTAAAKNKVTNVKTLDANESTDLNEAKHILEAGDTIQALADANTAVAIQVSGALTT